MAYSPSSKLPAGTELIFSLLSFVADDQGILQVEHPMTQVTIGSLDPSYKDPNAKVAQIPSDKVNLANSGYLSPNESSGSAPSHNCDSDAKFERKIVGDPMIELLYKLLEL